MSDLEFAKRSLAKCEVPTDITCNGFPVSEFNKEELIIMLGMARTSLENERKAHAASMGVIKALGHKVGNGKPC